MFQYDPKQPLDLEEKRAETFDGISAHEISYASPKGGRVPGILVVPPGNGPFPALLFGHWAMADWLQANRTEFLMEAIWLARAGVVSLLVDTTFARPEPWRRPAHPEDHTQDDEIVIHNVIDFRRGLDLLISRSDVDAKRIGYIGHSLGAGYGAILSGVENRIKAFVLMGGVGSLTELLRTSERPVFVEMRKTVPQDRFEKYLKAMQPFDAVEFVRRPRKAKLLLQFGRTDEFVPQSDADAFIEKAAAPKEVRWYNSGHELNAEALQDRTEWLGRQLGFPGSTGAKKTDAK